MSGIIFYYSFDQNTEEQFVCVFKNENIYVFQYSNHFDLLLSKAHFKGTTIVTYETELEKEDQ